MNLKQPKILNQDETGSEISTEERKKRPTNVYSRYIFYFENVII
jgi:hypothetical protein